MYLKNLKRKPTIIIIIFSIVGAIVTYVAFWKHNLFWLIIFYCMLLFTMIILSRYSSKKMMGLIRKKHLLIDQGKQYVPSLGKMSLLTFLIALPFYLIWFLISFIAVLDPYAFIMLNLPILTLSFLAFGFVYRVWNTLEGGSMLFWSLHIVIFFGVQLLGWVVRINFLKEFYF